MGKLYSLDNVIIRVWANDHLPPHFHITTPDTDAAVEIATMTVIEGTLPRGASARRALAWVEAHIDDIRAEWNRLSPFPIA